MNTKKLKQLVLDLAIHGKLVPQDPNDEPASELLKRIQADVETLGRASNKSKGKKSAVSSVDLDEVPFEVPEGWCWCRMQDVIRFVNGRAYKRDELLTKGKYKVLRVGNFFTNDSWYFSDLELEDEKYCYDGDLLYAWSASFGPKIWKGEKTIFHYHIWNVKYEDILYRDYLYYYLEYDKKTILDSTTGSTMIHIAMEHMNPRFIAIPPLAEQHRIVAAIEKWFAVIDQLEKNEADLKKSIEQTKKKVLDLAIRGKLVAQNPEDEPASELLARIRAEKAQTAKGKKSSIPSVDLDEVPFEVPNGWCWCSLDDLAFYKKGPFGSSLTKSMFVRESESTYKVYEQKNAIQKDASLGSYYINQEKFEELKGFEVLSNDIIVSCAGTIGETYVMPLIIKKGIINQALMIVRLYDKSIQDYYLMYFDYMLKQQASLDSKGTAIKNIPPFEILKSYYIPLPPLSEQHRIVEKVEEVFGVLERIEGMMC